ncbi:MAG TPA: hypothetical protein VMR89_02870 [Actinomycetota bacterium]|nr:hypothetical protein [Actinomycetota bacterium]
MPTDDHALVNRATWDEDARNWDPARTSQPYVPLEWARRWPSAEAWKVRKLR